MGERVVAMQGEARGANGGLRERKKADRRRAILGAARELFRQAGYAATTIESIGERAGISGVTVHNYFGTKSGVLLALVAESDAVLVDTIDGHLAEGPDDPVGAVMHFARMVRTHAISHLDRALWRQVIAASILEGDSRFGRSYHALDRRLAAALGRRLQASKERGHIAADTDPAALGAALFDVQNTAFVRFVADDALTEATMDERLARDLEALLGACVAQPPRAAAGC